MEEELILTSPVHLNIVSGGRREFPDSYRVNEAGMEYIKNYFNKKY